MALALTSAPAVEPVSLAEAKAHLRVDQDAEDDLISALIVSARSWVERQYGLALITQEWSFYLDRVPGAGAVALPLSPLQSVESVTIHSANGGTNELDQDAYAYDALSKPARLIFQGANGGASLRPLNGIEIAYRCGFGDAADDVPGPIRQALLLLIVHWFERREPVPAGGEPPEVPAMVAGLLAPYRQVRL
ncbi:Phage gp6-like head-tail connector protein [Methyloligella halotolerans]|uniref:Phage gp6-like head-tail connector protein n=1 Tax=Methyloligella halotolerans TaxID=1177755 RepID=A0A1E2RXH9_9HYPH|nr:head-tail connector protein [Methyloligella halotolerans]ODA66840.1 Phage gp6-like head-tail connector protein [Methyloligella halotolerans]